MCRSARLRSVCQVSARSVRSVHHSVHQAVRAKPVCRINSVVQLVVWALGTVGPRGHWKRARLTRVGDEDYEEQMVPREGGGYGGSTGVSLQREARGRGSWAYESASRRVQSRPPGFLANRGGCL